MKSISFPELRDKLIKLRLARKYKKDELSAKYLSLPPEYSIEFFTHPSFLNTELLLSTMWYYNGFIINLGELRMLVDPAVELLSRISSVETLLGLNTLFISHSHVDHYASAEIALEFMKVPSKNKMINIIGSSRVFRDKVISNFHAGITPMSENINRITIEHEKTFDLHNVKFTPVKMYHSISGTYGFVLEYNNLKIGYISDCGYTKLFKTTSGKKYNAGEGSYDGDFQEIISKHSWIKKHFSQVDYLITNLNDLLFNKHSKYHMTGFDLIDILKESNVKQCFIQHMHPVDLLALDSANLTSQYISEQVNIPVRIIPPTGLKVNLESV